MILPIQVVRLREAMRGYVSRLFGAYAATGEPIMRPMFYDFPDDPARYQFSMRIPI